MVEMVSPGVYVTETDMSEIVPTVSSSTAVFGGDFTKGPVETYTEITSVDDLIEFYGLPTDLNYNDWYQCYNFLQYGNRLLVSRACNLNGYPIFTNSLFVGISSQEGYGISNYGVFGYGIGEEVEVVLLDQDVVEIGDVIGFTDSSRSPSKAIDQSETLRYLVVDKSEVTTSLGNFYGIRLDRPLEIPDKYIDSYNTVADYYQTHSNLVIIRAHFNGSCEALRNDCHSMNSSDPQNEVPMLVTWKVSSIRYTEFDQATSSFKDTTQKVAYTVPVFVPDYLEGSDRVVQVKTTSEGFDSYTLNKINPKTPDRAFLFKHNKQILNPNDWDYKDSEGSISFSNASNSKLKFFSRTPGLASTLYSISIALPMDFASNDKDHIGNHCTRYVAEGIPVDSLFEFAPAKDSAQIAVVIYDTVNKEVKEKYLCSLDPNEKDNYNNSMFIEKVINRSSNLVYVKCNTSTEAKTKVDNYVSSSDYGEWEISDTEPKITVPNVCSYTLVADWDGNYYGQLLGFSCASDSTIQKDDLLNAYEVFENKDLIDVDIVISNELDNGESALNLAQKRLDCIAFMGIPYEYSERENIGILAVAKRSPEATSNIVKYRNRINYNTDRMALVANYKYQYDRYNDTYRWVNFAGDVAGLRARTNQDLAPWWASAGLNRGQLKNVVKLAYNPNQTQRNTLYTNGINPIVDFPGQGIVLWGQKTMLDKASSFDRVNVRCLFNAIERALAKMSKYQVMEFNDTFTRNRIIAIMKPYLATVQADRGIQDFEVICDTTNNTPDVISRNQLVVDIYIKPAYVAEMIRLSFINCGVNDFSSIISSSAD